MIIRNSYASDIIGKFNRVTVDGVFVVFGVVNVFVLERIGPVRVIDSVTGLNPRFTKIFRDYILFHEVVYSFLHVFGSYRQIGVIRLIVIFHYFLVVVGDFLLFVGITDKNMRNVSVTDAIVVNNEIVFGYGSEFGFEIGYRGTVKLSLLIFTEIIVLRIKIVESAVYFGNFGFFDFILIILNDFRIDRTFDSVAEIRDR